MTLEEILARIDAIDLIVSPLEEERAELELEFRKLRAAEWIAEHGVTRDNVQLTTHDSPGVPYLCDTDDAKAWILTLPVQHPFIVWNDCIYLRDDFIKDRICWDAPARLSDLQ